MIIEFDLVLFLALLITAWGFSPEASLLFPTPRKHTPNVRTSWPILFGAILLQAILDVLEWGSAIKKTPVVVGNCTGFAVNRVFFPYTMAACMLLDLGLDPYKVDRMIAGFGMPMGPFRWAGSKQGLGRSCLYFMRPFRRSRANTHTLKHTYHAHFEFGIDECFLEW